MPSLTTSRFVLTLILVAGSVVALVSLSPSTTQAQNPDDDEYAHVKGQDEYGPTYEVKQVPSQMRRALDAQGKCTVPSFINATMERDGSQCWVISQIPAAGTVITGPQSVTVQLEYTCNGVDTFWARLLVDAVDATPPTLAVQVQGDGQEPQTAPSGIRYFRSPVTLAVNAVTADNVDGARNAPHPDISIEVGCEVIPGVLELTEPGYYTLAVKAIDSSGNSTSTRSSWRFDKTGMSRQALQSKPLPSPTMEQLIWSKRRYCSHPRKQIHAS